mgnify:CR=1 FL=1
MRILSERRYRFLAPPPDVWAALSDVEHYASWWPWLARFDAEIRDTAVKRDVSDTYADAMGQILLAEGKGLEAVQEFRQADRRPDGPAFSCLTCLSVGLAQAYDQSGRADSAIKYYEHYLTTYDYDRYNFDPAFIHIASRRLGELYLVRGEPVRAEQRFRDVLPVLERDFVRVETCVESCVVVEQDGDQQQPTPDERGDDRDDWRPALTNHAAPQRAIRDEEDDATRRHEGAAVDH